MAKLTAIAKQRRILHLIKKGVPYLQITKLTGVSSATISRIKHRGHAVKRKPPEHARRSQGVGICPLCHHRVELPCIACSVPQRPLRASEDDLSTEPLEYELHEPEETRRQFVFARHLLDLEAAEEGEDSA